MKSLRQISTGLLALAFAAGCLGISSSQLMAQPQYQTNFTSVPQQSSIPFQNNNNNKAQWLYYPSDFGSPPSGFISKIYIKAAPSMLPVINNLNDFTIKMGQTTLMALPPGPWITANMNTVFYLSNINLWPIAGNWMEITLQTPFYFDNTQKFILEASQSSYTVGFDIMQGVMNARSLYGNISSLMANSQNYLLDFGFLLTQGPADASIESFPGLDDTLCAGSRPVVVQLKNNGPSTMTSVTIPWKVNNLSQPSFTWNGSLAPNASASVTLGNFNFQPAQSYAVLAYTQNPNNTADPNNSNDTMQFGIIQVLPAPSAQAQAPTYLTCPGDTVPIGIVLTGTAPWSLTYTDGGGAHTISNIISSPYILKLAPVISTQYQITSVSDAGGCPSSGTSSFMVGINPTPNVNLGADQTIKLSWTITLSAGTGFATYQWSTGGTGSSIQVTGASLGAGTHPISVTVTNSYNCRDSDTILITVRDDTGIEDGEATAAPRIYPNPAVDVLNVEIPGHNTGTCTVELYSPEGRLVLKEIQRPQQGSTTFRFNVEGLSEGLYLFRIITGDGATHKGKVNLLVN